MKTFRNACLFAALFAYEANAAVSSTTALNGDYSGVLALNAPTTAKLIMAVDTPTTITRSCVDATGTDPILIVTGNNVDDMDKVIIDTWTMSLVTDAGKYTGDSNACEDSTDAG
jgi:hypothetical protein